MPTTYDRVDTKIRRLEPEEEKPRVVVYDDGEVEGCVPEVQVAFEPLSPAGVPAADVEEALEMAEGEEEECPSPRSPPRLVLDLPPIPDEDVSDLIDPEQLELDFGDLDLPDLHFIV